MRRSRGLGDVYKRQFSGRSLGIGPAVAYKKSFSKESSIDFNLRWVKEFDVKNRLEGEPLVLLVAFAF